MSDPSLPYAISSAHAPPGEITEAVSQVMDALDWQAALGPDPTVLVKPNLGWDLFIPGSVTSSEVLAAVVAHLVKGGRQVIIIEADQVLVNMETAAKHAGVPSLRTSQGLLGQPEHLAIYQWSLPDARLFENIELPELIGAHPLVTIPVMKTHAKTAISGALKNSWGLLPIDRYRYHPRVDDGIIDLFQLAKPDLCILDATITLEGNGPKWGIPRRDDHIFGAHNGAVLDWFTAGLMGFDPDQIHHIARALPEGFTGADVLSISGDIPSLRPFLAPRHNLISGVEGSLSGSKIHRSIFDTPVFDVACHGARAWYSLWYHFGPGRASRHAP